jgi:hypothetical protein
MRGAAWPLSPVLGQIFARSVYDGRTWRRTRGAEWSIVKRFTVSGIYTASPDLQYAFIECWGAGGGGGWSRPSSAVSSHAAAGGGGSGGYSRITLPAELLVGDHLVTVAAGGFVPLTGQGGGFASDTMFGVYCTARGGGNAMAFDGTGEVPGAFGAPGLGAPPGPGDISMPGAIGSPWISMTLTLNTSEIICFQGGFGGEIIGGAQLPTQSTWIGSSFPGWPGLPNSGAGGGGGTSNTDTSTIQRAGGQGGSGLVVVTEVCGVPDGGGGPGPDPEPPIPGEPPRRPPGVPLRIDARVKLIEVPYCPPER